MTTRPHALQAQERMGNKYLSYSGLICKRQNNFIHMYCTQLSPTLLVDLKLANITEHQHGYHG